jgi:hypothetical protein
MLWASFDNILHQTKSEIFNFKIHKIYNMTFDLNFWLGFFGLLATIIFGALSIYLVKSRRYPGSITYIEEQSIGLFDSLVRNFSQIVIQYEGKNINEQIVLLKGYFLNTGNIDIKESMVEDKLKVSLPPEFKWLNAKIIEGTTGNKFSIQQITQNQLEIDLGLFKKNEYLRFEALAEVPISDKSKDSPSKSVSEKLSFSHRIADTNQVESKPLDLKLPKLKSKKFLFRLITPLLFLVYTVFVAITFFNKKDDMKLMAELHYLIKTPTNDTIEVKAIPQLDNTFRIKSIDKKFDKTIKADDFFNNYVIKTKISDCEDCKIFGLSFAKYLYHILLLMMILTLIVIVMPVMTQLLDYRRTKQIRNTLKLHG